MQLEHKITVIHNFNMFHFIALIFLFTGHASFKHNLWHFSLLLNFENFKIRTSIFVPIKNRLKSKSVVYSKYLNNKNKSNLRQYISVIKKQKKKDNAKIYNVIMQHFERMSKHLTPVYRFTFEYLIAFEFFFFLIMMNLVATMIRIKYNKTRVYSL
jgi:hypothetical protein